MVMRSWVAATVVQEWQEAPVVGITHLGRKPVRSCVVTHEVQHPVKALTIFVRHGIRDERLRGGEPADEELGHETVVRNRSLVIAAVSAHLVVELLDETARRPLRPCATFRPLVKTAATHSRPTTSER